MSIAVVSTPALADAHIESTLLADIALENDPPGTIRIETEADGGVWNERAEQGTTGRIIRYVYQRGGSARQVGAFDNYELINNEIVFETLIYLVTMVGENQRFEDLAAGDTRIKQLLHRSSGPNVVSCRYLSPHKELVPDDDQFYAELGGYYEITVQPT